MLTQTDPTTAPEREVPVAPAPTSGNKSWRTYTFEFLLLFAAVVLGFLADNIREQYSEQRQAMAYLQSFYEDLQSDTARISGIIAVEEQKIRILAATTPCYDAVTGTPSRADCLTAIVRNSMLSTPFVVTERTLQQLHTGGFRLLNKQDTDSIMMYVSLYQNLQDHQSTIYRESQLELRNSQKELMDFKAFTAMITDDVTRIDTNFRLPAGVTLLRSNDPNALNRFFNELQKYRAVAFAHVLLLKRIKKHQEGLMRYLKGKYDFE